MFRRPQHSPLAFHLALLATPTLWGMTLIASTSASLAQSYPPTTVTSVATQNIDAQLAPPAGLQTDSPEAQPASLPDSGLSITQTVVSPLVSPDALLVEPGSPSAVLSFSPLPLPIASMAQSNQNNANPASDPNTATNTSSNVHALATLVRSTDSRDLQPTGASLANGDFFPVTLAQSSDNTETPFPPGSAETPATDSTEAQTTETTTENQKWHFLLAPYLYVPFNINGSANFRNISSDFDFGPSQVGAALRNSLDALFFGELEAWTPNYHLGFLVNGDYASFSSERGRTFTLPVRLPGSIGTIPAELDVSADVDIVRVDLAASYRFYDPTKVNPNGVSTEFDLGPVLFDVNGGINITSINAELGLSTNLGLAGELDVGKTVVSPLLGVRFRWNAAPRFAVVLGGSVSGFGISGLSQYGFRGGIDWMFSGNTSLGLGYRFGWFNYNDSSSDLDLDINQNGPYLNFGFRF